MKWDSLIAATLADINREYGKPETDRCAVVEPECRMIWQTTRTNPQTGEEMDLCWGHAKVFDEWAERLGLNNGMPESEI